MSHVSRCRMSCGRTPGVDDEVHGRIAHPPPHKRPSHIRNRVEAFAATVCLPFPGRVPLPVFRSRRVRAPSCVVRRPQRGGDECVAGENRRDF